MYEISMSPDIFRPLENAPESELSIFILERNRMVLNSYKKQSWSIRPALRERTD
jgi:hypothetical protein